VRCEEGLLSDLEILERLVAEDQTGIFVSPLIDPDTQVGPASLDLRVGTELFTTQITTSTHVDLMASREEVGRQTREYFRIQRVGPGEAFVLHPGEFALAATLEYVRLPRDVAARL
jgi:dCTP deaminase